MKLVSKNIVKSIFEIGSEKDFEAMAMELFDLHANHNDTYKTFLRLIKTDTASVQSSQDIPHLPIQFFKTYTVGLQESSAELVFKSSGTTGMERSQHHIVDPTIYETSFLQCFQQFYGQPEDFHIFGLLPSYLEQGDSSLVYMVNHLIEASESKHSGFYLNNYADLEQAIQKAQEIEPRKILLFGVSYALLDFAEKGHTIPQDTIVIETGGMKGRRKEMTKAEMYAILQNALQVPAIHSEYGMTELLSQAYAHQDNIFQTPNWMKINVRNPNDFREIYPHQKTGGINITDLANVYSCPFIATDDLGKTLGDETFTILGRFDHSDLRGCNLLVQ